VGAWRRFGDIWRHYSGTFEIWGIAKDIGKHCNKWNKNLVCRHIVQELIAH